MTWLDVLQFVGATGFIVSLAPQLWRTLRLKQAYDVSLWFLVILEASSAILLVYAYFTRQYFFVVSYLANLAVWGVVLYYRIRPAIPAAS